MILPEGYELEFVVPSGSPEVFKNLIEYIDKEISLILCGENEAGQAEAGSRASSQVANTVRVVRASELSEMLSHTLTQTLVRWIVDLNFGTDVTAPVLTREFRIEESPLTMPDVALMIQSGYTPRKEWLERHFRVELEEKKESGEEGESTTYNPQEDQDLFGSIFGAEGQQAATEGKQSQPETATGANPQAAAADLQAAANVMDTPAGATPEESQADTGISDEDIYNIFGLGDEEEEPQKPFGNEDITEDEAVNMNK
jgi:phage gp29-like protein